MPPLAAAVPSSIAQVTPFGYRSPADLPGLYALGLRVLRRRRSTYRCGIEDDAREVVGDLSGALSPAA